MRGQLERALEGLSLCDHLRDEPELERLAGAEPRSQEHELLRPRGADETCKPVGAARARDDAERHLREPEDRGLVGDPEVGGQRELEPAAEAVAVDGAQRRLRQGGDPFVDVPALPVVGGNGLWADVPELVDIRTRREGSSRSGENDHRALAHLLAFERLEQSLLERGGEGVELALATEDEDASRAFPAHLQQPLVHHVSAPQGAPLPAGGRLQLGNRRKQLPRVLGLGGVEHPVGRAGLDDASVAHHHDPVRDRPHERKVVGHEEHREAHLPLESPEQLDDRGLDGDVERRRDLVADQKRRLAHERARDGDPLPLSAGERSG